MRDRIRKNTVASCWIIFLLLIIVHGFEAIVLRMDETSFGENFINKVFGIIVVSAFLFGVWHIVTPLHNLIDGDIDVGVFLGLGIGYIIFAGMMGIKWALLYRMTGSLYSGMADHFFNNCIATNLLHITTESGTDEMMIIRVMIAQLLSFIVVVLVWKNKRNTVSPES